VSSQTIMIIRHAEKPEPGADRGVNLAGQPDNRSLTPRGWQRAGGWSELFVPSLSQNARLPRPTALFASAPNDDHPGDESDSGSKSRRPYETLTTIAAKLNNLKIALKFEKGEEIALAAALSNLHGVSLVCWQHENILAICKALTPPPQDLPLKWPGDRFNVIFMFERAANTQDWSFQQFAPVMLAGDSTQHL
jgi:hypothetical protein